MASDKKSYPLRSIRSVPAARLNEDDIIDDIGIEDDIIDDRGIIHDQIDSVLHAARPIGLVLDGESSHDVASDFEDGVGQVSQDMQLANEPDNGDDYESSEEVMDVNYDSDELISESEDVETDHRGEVIKEIDDNSKTMQNLILWD